MINPASERCLMNYFTIHNCNCIKNNKPFMASKMVLPVAWNIANWYESID